MATNTEIPSWSVPKVELQMVAKPWHNDAYQEGAKLEGGDLGCRSVERLPTMNLSSRS